MEQTVSLKSYFKRFIKPHRWQIILASTYSAFDKLFDIFPELLIGLAINVVVKKQHSFIAQYGLSDPFQQILSLGVITMVIWSLESLFQFLQTRKWRSIAQSVQHHLRIDAYAHMQRLGMAYYEDKNVGQLITILNEDINQFERFINRGLNEAIQLIVGTLVIGGVFIYLAPQIAAVALIPLPIVFVVVYYFQRLLKPRYQRVRKQASDLGARLGTNIMGVSTIKSYTAERYELERLKKESNAYRDARERAIFVVALFIPLLRMVIACSFVITLIMGGWYTLNGRLDIGAYSIMVFQTQRLLWPFQNIGKMVNMYQQVMASLGRVNEILKAPVKIVSGGQRLPVEKVKGDISFDDVSFYYPSGMQGLSHVTLSIKAGQTVAFVGATGSGKSTIVKLILRFYDVSDGVIKLDSYNIADLKLKDLRNAIGLVSQDVFLFPGSIRENIAYGRRDANLNDIIRAAKIAEAHEFIMRLPEQYDTEVGERGVTLSGGQRQRVSIARAVLKNPPVFIFDEATSAVDNETEAAIQRSLEKIMVDHTTILIAHRLSTVRNADMIFVMDTGQIAQVGTHEQLIAKDGIYKSLWQVQTGGN